MTTKILEAICYERGREIARWNSLRPGQTGPDSLVRDHAHQARKMLPAWRWDGWVYRWRKVTSDADG
jgi:hypothetical protein